MLLILIYTLLVSCHAVEPDQSSHGVTFSEESSGRTTQSSPNSGSPMKPDLPIYEFTTHQLLLRNGIRFHGLRESTAPARIASYPSRAGHKQQPELKVIKVETGEGKGSRTRYLTHWSDGKMTLESKSDLSLNWREPLDVFLKYRTRANEKILKAQKKRRRLAQLAEKGRENANVDTKPVAKRRKLSRESGSDPELPTHDLITQKFPLGPKDQFSKIEDRIAAEEINVYPCRAGHKPDASLTITELYKNIRPRRYPTLWSDNKMTLEKKSDLETHYPVYLNAFIKCRKAVNQVKYRKRLKEKMLVQLAEFGQASANPNKPTAKSRLKKQQAPEAITSLLNRTPLPTGPIKIREFRSPKSAFNPYQRPRPANQSNPSISVTNESEQLPIMVPMISNMNRNERGRNLAALDLNIPLAVDESMRQDSPAPAADADQPGE